MNNRVFGKIKWNGKQGSIDNKIIAKIKGSVCGCFNLTVGLPQVGRVMDREFGEKSQWEAVVVKVWYKACSHFYNL